MKTTLLLMALVLLAILAVIAVPFAARAADKALETAAGVAKSFGFPIDATVRADYAQSLEELSERMDKLNQDAKNIRARAEAENNRDLTDEERRDLDAIMAAFTAADEDYERIDQMAQMEQRAGTRRRTDPAGGDDGPSRASRDRQAAERNDDQDAQPRAQRRASLPAQAKDHRETGKHGFNHAGEFYKAVLQGSAKGGKVDPRLLVNAPSTYGNEGTGADGGFAVPPDFRTEIIRKVMGEESLLSRTDQQTSSSNSITFPTDETTPWQASGGVQAYWESEGGQKTQSKPSLKETTVKANKVIALVPMTDELLEDAPAMARYVSSKAPEKIEWKVTDAIVNGTGVGQPLGILNSAGTIVVPEVSGQAADTVRFENIVDMYSRLYSRSRTRAVWLMNPDAEAKLPYMQFVNQGSGNAVPVYLPPGGLSSSPYSTLFGRPIITSEAMPALGDQGDIVLADMSQYLTLVKAGGIKQDVSIHLFFDYDITAFRFVMRVGGQPWWNTAIERPNGGTTRGFFVALGARS